MESKYKERACQLMEQSKLFDAPYNADIVAELMCQLAEEVEKKTISSCLTPQVLYTKDQVEDFLQKQRKLCSTEDNRINASTIRSAKLKID